MIYFKSFDKNKESMILWQCRFMLPLNLLKNRIVFTITCWCFADGCFKEISIADMQRNWKVLFGHVGFLFSLYFLSVGAVEESKEKSTWFTHFKKLWGLPVLPFSLAAVQLQVIKIPHIYFPTCTLCLYPLIYIPYLWVLDKY